MTLSELGHHFDRIWLVDFEFHQPDGERPTPLCLVAKEFFTGRTIRHWNADNQPPPPYDIGPRDLFVSYYSTAELSCHLALDWQMPSHLIDLYVEFRRMLGGIKPLHGHGLLGALAYFGLPGVETVAKDDMRALAVRGGPYTPDEQAALLSYCESDVIALERLLSALLSHIDLPRALIRGEYLKALAPVEWRGIPVDMERYRILTEHWDAAKVSLIEVIDRDYGVYEGGTFRQDRFKALLRRQGIAWPLLESGEPALDEDTFRDMAKAHPFLKPLKQLRATLGKLRLCGLKIGRDGRNRCLLSPFASSTGRNQPSTSSYIFGPAVWTRHLIKPPAGRALAYVDWSQQEFGIAASLSEDAAMMRAYESDDPYLTFAKQAGAAPANATRESHKHIREQFKVCALAVQYGMGEGLLGQRLGLSPAHGRELIAKHRVTYSRYWLWSDAVQDTAMFHGSLESSYGWRVRVGLKPNPRSLRNFPVQANGAEMLRLAMILAHQRGVQICAPVHDALLIEADIADIEAAVLICQEAMAEASTLVLPGFRLRTDAKIVRAPDRYSDERGTQIWDTLWSLPVIQNAQRDANLEPSQLFHE